jgi:hypothetical protein
MIRFLYRSVLRLHPQSFRRRFGDEMLSIFDQSPARWLRSRLLLDAVHSLFRQWVLRPEFLIETPAHREQPACDGLPSFSTLDPFRPRASAVVPGLVLSIVIFCLTCVAIRYSWIRVLNVHIPEVQFEAPQWIPPNPADVTTPPDNPPPVAADAKHPAPSLPATVELPAKIPPHSQPTVRTLKKLPARVLAVPERAQGKREAAVSPPASLPAVELESPLEVFEGTYEVASPHRMTIVIGAEDDRLTMRLSGQPKRTLVEVSGMKFRDTEDRGCTIEFVGTARLDGEKISRLELYLNGQHFTASRH